MKKEKTIFILDHYYNVNHLKQCLVIESDKSVEEMVQITSAISFLLEDMTDPSYCLEEEWLLECLENFYDVKNVKSEIDSLQFKRVQMPINGVYETTSLKYDNQIRQAYIVDLYEARESCCGTNYAVMMKTRLPKEEKLRELADLLLKRFTETYSSKKINANTAEVVLRRLA